MGPPSRFDQLHEEARNRARARVAAMAPGEWMELAYRLFTLARDAR